ncbi:serine hydrolase domain-containing protein [Nocardia sp. NPDC057440]|uniref:serine hydrolase domain-containing protein n=1 Tax=Nocardia sp. NPDC057440 TaxID=3346134 RepID=UPI00366A8E89
MTDHIKNVESHRRSQAGHSNTARALDTLDARLRMWEQERGYSGIAVIARGGVREFEGCYGLANRSEGIPVSTETRFGLASVTKMFTAVAVARFVRSGLVSFDTAVRDILPAGRRPTTLRPDVTVHHLLSHTSGIADYFEEGEDYAALWTDRPNYRILCPADMLSLFANLAPHGRPGQRFQYSNAGFVLLGLIVEEIAGVPYPDAVAESVFEPAGLTSTGFFALDEVHSHVAIGYLPPREAGGPWRSNIYSIPSMGGPDGGAFATAADLDRFLRAYADGTLLGDQLRAAMLTPRCVVRDGVEVGYGVFLHGGGRFGHTGEDPGCEVMVQHLPEFDTSVVALCNMNGYAHEIGDLMVELVLKGFSSR